MHHLRYALIALVIFTAPGVFAADTTAVQHEREAYAKDFAQAVLAILHNPKESYTARQDILRRSFASSVDTNWIARFVLGRAWRDATDEQRERYTSLYSKYLTETYVTNFAENPQKSIYDIKILTVDTAQEGEFFVHTRMQLMTAENLRVDYRVGDKDGHYKILDITIENVSLINTHRAEFTALASAQGVGGVIKKLEALTANSRREMTLSMK